MLFSPTLPAKAIYATILQMLRKLKPSLNIYNSIVLQNMTFSKKKGGVETGLELAGLKRNRS